MKTIRTISFLLLVVAFSVCNTTHAGSDNKVIPGGSTADEWTIDENKVLDNSATSAPIVDWTDELIDLAIEFLLGPVN